MSSHDYPITCPTCGAGPWWPCHSLTKGYVTDTHVARIRWRERQAELERRFVADQNRTNQ